MGHVLQDYGLARVGCFWGCLLIREEDVFDEAQAAIHELQADALLAVKQDLHPAVERQRGRRFLTERRLLFLSRSPRTSSVMRPGPSASSSRATLR